MRFRHVFAIAGLRLRCIGARASVALLRRAARAVKHAFFAPPLPLIFDPLSRYHVLHASRVTQHASPQEVIPHGT